MIFSLKNVDFLINKAAFPGVVALIFYIEMQKEPDGQRQSIYPAILWGVAFVLLLALLRCAIFHPK